MASRGALKASQIQGVGRELGVGSLAGMLVGVVVGGIGARVAMRLIGIMTAPSFIGTQTANGNRVGDITLSGTLELVVFDGAIAGALGGALYAVVRPWLARSGRWAGLAFGAFLLAALGSAILDPQNGDFRRLGSPPLDVALFAVIFVVFGLLIVPLAERIAQALASGRTTWTDALRAVVWLATLPAGAISVILVAAAVGDLIRGTEPRLPAAFVFVGLILVALALRSARKTTGRLSYALLAAPSLAGLLLTLDRVAKLMEL